MPLTDKQKAIIAMLAGCEMEFVEVSRTETGITCAMRTKRPVAVVETGDPYRPFDVREMAADHPALRDKR